MDQQQNHIVSLIAVFLALGIGILIGASMGEKALVLHQLAFIEELKGEIMHYKEEINSQFASFSKLQEELLRWESLEEEYLNPSLIENKLEDIVIKVIVYEDIEKELEDFLRQSGASYHLFVFKEASSWQDPFFMSDNTEIFILSGSCNGDPFLTSALENLQQQGKYVIQVTDMTEMTDDEITVNVSGNGVSFPVVNNIDKFYNKIKLLELIQNYLQGGKV